MKRWIHASTETIVKNKVNEKSRQTGYQLAGKYINKYKKAMKVLAQ